MDGNVIEFQWEKYGAIAQKLYKHHLDGKQLHRFENKLTHILYTFGSFNATSCVIFISKCGHKTIRCFEIFVAFDLLMT